jgi:heme exporter protein A
MNEPARASISATRAFGSGPVSARGLTLVRGERVLFRDLGFDIAPGGALLLRGPNGSGKSSLLLALAGIVRLEAGLIEGFERTDLHLLNYQSGLKARLTVTENLGFWRAMHGAGELDLATALDRVGIAPLAGLEAGYLSSGQLRRLALARLLVSPRRIWLLDEPTATLDAAGEALLAELCDEHLASGGIAIVATHHELGLTTPAQTITLGGAA